MKKTKIIIKDISVFCTVGVTDEERSQKQEVLVNLAVTVDGEKSSASDDVSDTVNYKEVYLKVIDSVETSQFHLLEALCRHLCSVCLQYSGVLKVKVSVTKPHRLPRTQGVTVEMEEENE